MTCRWSIWSRVDQQEECACFDIGMWSDGRFAPLLPWRRVDARAGAALGDCLGWNPIQLISGWCQRDGFALVIARYLSPQVGWQRAAGLVWRAMLPPRPACDGRRWLMRECGGHRQIAMDVPRAEWRGVGSDRRDRVSCAINQYINMEENV